MKKLLVFTFGAAVLATWLAPNQADARFLDRLFGHRFRQRHTHVYVVDRGDADKNAADAEATDTDATTDGQRRYSYEPSTSAVRRRSTTTHPWLLQKTDPRRYDH